jgi:hypothetical protein
MCLIALKTEEFKIAEKDIKCYKVVDIRKDKGMDVFYPRYYDKTAFRYKKGVTYQTEIGVIDFTKDVTTFDLQERDDYGKYTAWSDRHCMLNAYTSEFHSATSKKRVRYRKRYKESVLVSCTIPKGSKYLINKSRLIVSDSIRIDNIVT